MPCNRHARLRDEQQYTHSSTSTRLLENAALHKHPGCISALHLQHGTHEPPQQHPAVHNTPLRRGADWAIGEKLGGITMQNCCRAWAGKTLHSVCTMAGTTQNVIE